MTPMTPETGSKDTAENRQKRRFSIRKSQSSLSINSNFTDFKRINLICRLKSFKRNKVTTKDDEFVFSANDAISGNLTSLDIHDSEGDVIVTNGSLSAQSNVSSFYFYNKPSLKSSTVMCTGVSDELYVPTSKPPVPPSAKSPVLDNWEPYTSFASNNSLNKDVYKITNRSFPNSMSGILKKIPHKLMSVWSVKQPYIDDKAFSDNDSDDSFVIEDVAYILPNKMKVELNKVTPASTTNWKNLFRKSLIRIRDPKSKQTHHTSSVSIADNVAKFKKPHAMKNTQSLAINPILQSSTNDEDNIVPQIISFSEYTNEVKSTHIQRHGLLPIDKLNTVASQHDATQPFGEVIDLPFNLLTSNSSFNNLTDVNVTDVVRDVSSLCLLDNSTT